MDNTVDPNDPRYEYHAQISPTSTDRFDYAGSISSSHDTSFGGVYPIDYSSYDTIAPSNLQLSHTSHDDLCLDHCPAGYDSHGFPRSSYPTPSNSRSRFSTVSCPFPYSSVVPPNFLPSAQHYAGPMYPFQMTGSDLKYSMHPGRNSVHDSTSSGQSLGVQYGVASFGVSSESDSCITNCGLLPLCLDKEPCLDEEPCMEEEPCLDESCAPRGVPCDSDLCLTNNPSSLGYPWDIYDDIWPVQHHSVHGLPLHNQPCNHTNTEHDVAKTLRDLKGPGASNEPPESAFGSFECPVFDHNNYGTKQPSTSTVTSTSPVRNPPLTSNNTNASNADSARPSVSVPRFSDPATQYTCQWIVNGDEALEKQTCGQTFSDSEALHNHLGKDHVGDTTTKTKYRCLWHGCTRQADQTFASRNKLRRHISTHTAYKPFKCDTCGEGFSAQQALDQHIRTHTGDKPFHCDIDGCTKSFKQKSALTMHKRTHTGEKPLQCEICGKCFCESSNLSKHRKIHAQEKPFKCASCDKTFARLDQMKRHETRHQLGKDKGKTRVRKSTSSLPTRSHLLKEDQLAKEVTKVKEEIMQHPILNADQRFLVGEKMVM